MTSSTVLMLAGDVPENSLVRLADFNYDRSIVYKLLYTLENSKKIKLIYDNLQHDVYYLKNVVTDEIDFIIDKSTKVHWLVYDKELIEYLKKRIDADVYADGTI